MSVEFNTSPMTVTGKPRRRAYPSMRAKKGEAAGSRILRFITEDRVGCWIWQATTNEFGYGRLTIEGRTLYAHRVSYEAFVGPIPDGLHLDHLCRVTSCVNPAHLEPVTCQINTLRGEGFAAKNAQKDECPSGHPYNAENTYHCKGRRYCRTCQRAHNQKWREKKLATSQDPQVAA